MTTGAASLRTRGSGHMLRVIKLYIERLVETGGKVFEWRVVAADVGVTDLTHWRLRRRELAAMAFGASLVTRKAWRR